MPRKRAVVSSKLKVASLPKVKKRVSAKSPEKEKSFLKPFKDKFKEYADKVFDQGKSKIWEKEPAHNYSPTIQKMQEDREFSFPTGYGDNKIVLLVRDTHWLYTYWELALAQIQGLRERLGSQFIDHNLTVRVVIVDHNEYFDINVFNAGICGNWYINAGKPNTAFYVQIGYIGADGKFYPLATSNTVKTPRDGVSEIVDEEWFIPDWEKLFALSGGLNFASGSFGLKELLERRLKEQTSSEVSSLSSPQMPPRERPFFLVADTELIVYGATEPSASVTIKGCPIKLRPDGTFSVRYALPDGIQNIPIEAIRDDGAEKRKITPVVERRTY